MNERDYLAERFEGPPNLPARRGFDQDATRHNAPHRRAEGFRAFFTSVPKRSRLHARNRRCFPGTLKHATVRKTVASANVKFRSAKC
jgi:hypothetical protein